MLRARKIQGSVVVCVLGLLALPMCKKTAPIDANGTIVITVSSELKVDRVQLRAFSPEGEVADIEFDTAGVDITQTPVTGEVTPGMAVKGGQVMFVGFGLIGGQVVAAGRVATAFEAKKKGAVTLTLVANVIDIDRDGFNSNEDCDDNNSKRNGFLTERCETDMDDDCDGSVNESCACEANSRRRCYDGMESTRGLGECTDGEQICVAGVWGECQGAIIPKQQQCSGRDDDCDGSVDEGCPCTTGTQRFCYDTRFTTASGSPADFALLGECRAGTQQCEQATWGLCVGAVLPTTEACDGLDNDCDGSFDNGFDNDNDTYTTCGTNHASCPGAITGGGTNALFVDCDDGSPDRHPCQSDRCDTLEDLDCSGEAFVCLESDKGSCESAGFFGGYAPGTDQCRFLAGTFGEQCTAGGLTCVDAAGADCIASNGAASTGPVFARADCRQPAGCEPGTQNPPSNGTPITSGDPFSDCPNQTCNGVGANRVYAGIGGADPDRSGWRLVGSGKTAVFECHVYQGANGNCESDGTCEEPYEACQRAAGPTEQVAGGEDLGPCKEPAGATYENPLVTAATDIYASNCRTTAAGVSDAPLAGVNIGNGSRDPARRCPEMAATCTTRVKTEFPAPSVGLATASCVLYSNQASGGRTEFLCASGGVCRDATGNGCNGNTDGTSITCADSRCTDPSQCVANAVVGTNLCLNSNNGTPGGVARPGSCPTGQRCHDMTANGNNAVCKTCNLNNACGDTCRSCGGATSCSSGFDAASNPQNADTNSAKYSCACAAKTGLTVHMPCGNTCCGANRFCNAGTCSAESLTLAACGNVQCAAGEYCDTTTQGTAAPTFVCRAAAAGKACNQRECGAAQFCSNFAESTCSSCIVDTACGTGCVDCPGPQTCQLPAAAGVCTEGALATCTCQSP